MPTVAVAAEAALPCSGLEIKENSFAEDGRSKRAAAVMEKCKIRIQIESRLEPLHRCSSILTLVYIPSHTTLPCMQLPAAKIKPSPAQSAIYKNKKDKVNTKED